MRREGLDCIGLKRADMLALLKQTEADEVMAPAAADDGESGSDEEVTVDGAAGDGSGDNTNSSGAYDSETVTALRIKLLLAKEKRLLQKKSAELKEVEWEREKERIALLGAAGSGARFDSNSDGRGYRGQLPHMQDDVLAFFHALEKTLHLNSVPQIE